jgi:hypothetical protein
MELVYTGEGKYGGVDVGVGGERYKVIEEGSRQLIRGVPNDCVERLAVHKWLPTGGVELSSEQMVEQAAQKALADKAAEEKAAAEKLEADKKAADEKAAADKKAADDKKKADKKE